MLNKIFGFLGVVITFARVTHGGFPITDDNLSGLQRFSAEDLREISHAMMKEDYLLPKWLESNNFNVVKTANSFRQYLKLRKELNIDQILNENWSDMRKQFPYYRNTTDKIGRPLLYIDMAEWDMISYPSTEAALNRFIRYFLMISEESGNHVRRLRAQGRNVTQFSVIFNVGGFSPVKHLCMQCASFYETATSLLTTYTKVHVQKLVLVNVSNRFKSVYFHLSDNARKLIRLYGQDQNKLRQVLLEYIKQDQIPKGIFSNVPEKDNSEGSIMWNA